MYLPFSAATMPLSSVASTCTPGSGRGNNRCPDKDRMKGAATKPDNRDIGLERLLLPAKRVPVHSHIHEPKGMHSGVSNMRCHQHHTGAGRKDPAGEGADRFVEAVPVDQPGYGRGLPPRDRKRCTAAEIRRILTSITEDSAPLPRRRSAAAKASICSLTSPCNASTPILTATGLQHLIGPEGVNIKTRHRVAKTPADLCDHRRRL